MKIKTLVLFAFLFAGSLASAQSRPTPSPKPATAEEKKQLGHVLVEIPKSIDKLVRSPKAKGLCGENLDSLSAMIRALQAKLDSQNVSQDELLATVKGQACDAKCLKHLCASPVWKALLIEKAKYGAAEDGK